MDHDSPLSGFHVAYAYPSLADDAVDRKIFYLGSNGSAVLISRITGEFPVSPLLKDADRSVDIGYYEDGRKAVVCPLTDDELLMFKEYQPVETRALIPTLSSQADVSALSRASQLLYMAVEHAFCGRCGGPCERDAKEPAMRCLKCGTLLYPTINPATITLIERGDEILLAHNRNFPDGLFSLIAGFNEAGENLHDTVMRETYEEVGIKITDIQYARDGSWPHPHSLMLGFTARWESGEILCDGAEITEAAWFRRDALPTIPRKGVLARALIDAWIWTKD